MRECFLALAWVVVRTAKYAPLRCCEPFLCVQSLVACGWCLLQCGCLVAAVVKTTLRLVNSTELFATTLRQTPYSVLTLSLALYSIGPPLLLLAALTLPHAASRAVVSSSVLTVLMLISAAVGMITIPLVQLIAAFD